MKKNIGINLHVLGWGNEFLSYDTKAQQRKEIIGKLDFIEIKNFHASEDTIKEVKRQATEWGKYLWIIYLIRLYQSQYVKNSYNSTIKRQIAQFKNGQKYRIIISEDIPVVPINTWKDIQHHYRNANQGLNEILLCIQEDGYNKKDRQQKQRGHCWWGMQWHWKGVYQFWELSTDLVCDPEIPIPDTDPRKRRG